MNEFYSDDLPPEAKEWLDAAEREVDAIRAKSTREAERIRAKTEKAVAALEEKTAESIRGIHGALVQRLKPLQESYAKEGKLDEALAIRARIRQLRAEAAGVRPAPATLACDPRDAGKSFLFEVTGSCEGPLWGTDVYTADSSLAAAAVHAGLLQPGERGIVRVTLLDTSDRAGFEGSRRNGVYSEDWDRWEMGFRVSRP